MNYRIFSAIVIAVSIISAVFISGPARSGETANDGFKLAASDSYFEGILAIKEGHGEILVRPENGNDKNFKIKDNTIITRNGKPATFDDLRARDQLRVRYDSKRVVIELHANGS
jgi:hypothetical protein